MISQAAGSPARAVRHQLRPMLYFQEIAPGKTVTHSERQVLALDVGGTNFRLALVGEDGSILRQCRGSNPSEDGPGDAIRTILEAAGELLSGVERGALSGMGIAIAGLVTPKTGVLLTSPNLLSWYNTPVKDIFERELGIPVHVGNDANMAVLGEHRFGAGVGSDDVIYITWSTGIGGGVIAGGRLLTGSRGFAAELGHMTIDLNGPKCNCGNIGCLEMMASGTAIARLAAEALSGGAASAMTGLTRGGPATVTARTVAEAARSGDRLALDILRTAATNLGVGLVNLVHMFNPEIIVLGGGVSQSGDILFPTVREVVAERAMPDYSVRIEPAALGDDCGLLGAAALVLEDLA